MKTFDPHYERDLMVEVALIHGGWFEPEELHPASIPQKVTLCVDLLLQCYWLGLVAEAKPRLQAIVDWMEKHDPPGLETWKREEYGWRAPWHYQFNWWQSLGLAKWLVSDASGAAEFEKAMEVERDSWRHATPLQLQQWHEEGQETLPRRLAVALGTDQPAYGLQMYDATGVGRLRRTEKPVYAFSRWACEYLAAGCSRDTTFVQQGEAMLTSSLLPHFFQRPMRTEPALWLKAIYFDSGVTKTAEETMLRAYDCMPGVPRPDFLP